MKKYRRVTYADRCQIDALLKTKKTITEISLLLGFHKSSISREIRRNAFRKSIYSQPEYNYFEAQGARVERYARCRRRSRIRDELEVKVRDGLRRFWSPEQISGRLRRECGIILSYQSIYRYTRRLKSFRPYLAFKGIHYKKAGKLRDPRKVNIRERPDVCSSRSRIGDWERDTMFVKNRKAILVCTDRKSRYTKLQPLTGTHSKVVWKSTLELLIAAGKKVHTLTNDNGSEFTPLSFMLGDAGIRVFHCDPGRPHQRGTVENTIGVLRRFIKQDSEQSGIDYVGIESWMNSRPRKVLDYRTPHEVFYGERVALAV